MLSESVPGTPPEVFAPVEVPSPSQPPEEVEYVQLLTPEGERVDNPDDRSIQPRFPPREL